MNLGIYPVKNYGIWAFHSIYRHPPVTPFKGALPEVKAKVHEVLSGLGAGWTVKAVTDGQTIYCREAR